MRIMVLAFANFREILGKERELHLNESATVKDLLEELAAARPAFKDAAFDDTGALRDYVLLMVNQKRIDPPRTCPDRCKRETSWPSSLPWPGAEALDQDHR